MTDFPTDSYLRAARYYADFSQRELAAAAGLSPTVVARMETEPRLARVQGFAQALEACRLHLVVLDDSGYDFPIEHAPIAALRDRGMRRFPAHLDVRPASTGWWGSGWPMFQGREPEFTFDRARWRRDARRERLLRRIHELREADDELHREADAEQRIEADDEP